MAEQNILTEMTTTEKQKAIQNSLIACYRIRNRIFHLISGLDKFEDRY